MFDNTSKVTRRTFVKGVVATGVLAATWTSLQARERVLQQKETVSLFGTEFHLSIDKTMVNITGVPSIATTVNGMLIGPTLQWKEGDTVTIHVTNNLDEDTSIHWHGIILPPNMDGVPRISFDSIAPGANGYL